MEFTLAELKQLDSMISDYRRIYITWMTTSQSVQIDNLIQKIRREIGKGIGLPSTEWEDKPF